MRIILTNAEIRDYILLYYEAMKRPRPHPFPTRLQDLSILMIIMQGFDPIASCNEHGDISELSYTPIHDPIKERLNRIKSTRI